MQKDRFERWLQNIYRTRDEEISCSECFDSVSQYVEMEISGDHPEVKMAQVNQHLEQCPACHAEYEALRDFRRMEEEGDPPSLDDLQNLIP